MYSCNVTSWHRDTFCFLLIFKINKKKDEFCNLQKLVILLVLSFKFGAGAISGYRRNGKVKISFHNGIWPWIYGYRASCCCSCILYLFWIKNRFIFMIFCLRMFPKSCIFAIHFTITLMQCNWLGNNQKTYFWAMAAMLTIFFTLCVSVLLLTVTVVYCPFSAFGGGVAIGILSFIFATNSFSTPSSIPFDSG